ncbi:hypothetical protein [Microseira wollei]|uniref:hypothetical protein n=1 Tax=Microseira wollei TaxID=467598 RepID=UPI001CFE0723|nr:hypothetical protein [Microseira wollei]
MLTGHSPGNGETRLSASVKDLPGNALASSQAHRTQGLFSEYDGEATVLSLTSVKFEIPLGDIYQ